MPEWFEWKERPFFLTFTPNNNLLIYSDFSGTIKIFDIKSGKHIMVIEASDHLLSGISVDPEGNHIITTDDFVFKSWDIETGLLIDELNIFLDWIS